MTLKRTTAIHEAGHATAAHFLGRSVRSVDIVATGERAGSFFGLILDDLAMPLAHVGGAARSSVWGNAVTAAIILLAGKAAEELHGGRLAAGWVAQNRRTGKAWMDVDRVYASAEALFPHETRRGAEYVLTVGDWAADVVRHTWPGILVLASKLAHLTKLTGDAATDAIEAAQPGLDGAARRSVLWQDRMGRVPAAFGFHAGGKATCPAGHR